MDARQMKIKAAEAALSHVQDGMRLGIGTGSTAEEFVRLLAEKVAAGLKVEACRHPSVPRACASSLACR